MYATELERKSSGVLFLNPIRKIEFIQKILNRKDETTLEEREKYERLDLDSKKRKGLGRKGKINVGIQCSWFDDTVKVDKVPVL